MTGGQASRQTDTLSVVSPVACWGSGVPKRRCGPLSHFLPSFHLAPIDTGATTGKTHTRSINDLGCSFPPSRPPSFFLLFGWVGGLERGLESRRRDKQGLGLIDPLRLVRGEVKSGL